MSSEEINNPQVGHDQPFANDTGAVVQSDKSWFQRAIIGDYKYSVLCKPRWNPRKKAEEGEGKLEYFGPDDELPLIPAIFLGFQHSIAVLGGTVIPGILLGNQDPSGQAGRYLVS